MEDETNSDMKIKSKPTPNREYQDSVFVDLHSNDEILREEAVMDIYNALHDKKITQKEQVKFIKLKSVFFHKVRNDVSFVVNGKLLVLLEHQSTINENMPYRCLEYSVATLGSQMNPRDKFLTVPLKLFNPEFYVIYSGDASYPARKVQRLSDLFEEKVDNPQLELIVTVININHPDNKEFLDSCPVLKGYKRLVERVKKYKKLYNEDGYIIAIEECIRENTEISDYLRRKTMEVRDMFSLEYNYNDELEAYRFTGIKQGIKQGIQQGSYDAKIETAKNCLNIKMPVETIAKITGLTEKEIGLLIINPL